ncbi:MAG TPA: 3-(methylthio)propionyl-CoA ligase [Usitatibacteraceae bacterium]|nr:3-(methylthio)propionyl-CoA ligase [Usitatibacteraceae bacterium]
MRSGMQQRPLLISSLIDHAATISGDVEIVSRPAENGGKGPLHRYDFRAAQSRSKRLANALARLGIGPGDRVGTLAWNTHRHFELYYGVSGMGAVIHTVNPRLFPEQIVYIVNHAEDCCMFFDVSFAPLIEKIAPMLGKTRLYVALAERKDMPVIPGIEVLCYEDLLAGESDAFDWPLLDEQTPSSLCYTSGTTGNPKGVLYSHRSTLLHTYAAMSAEAFCLNARDAVLPVVPMFHVNAWSLPYLCAAAGVKLVLPGPALDGASLYELMESERVTVSAGVPTVWLGLLNHVKANGLKFGSLRETVIGGSACPPAMIRSFEEDFGVQVIHAWGMTELSPLGSMCRLKAKHADLDREAKLAVKAKQGRPIFGVEMKIIDAQGRRLPHDGVTFGDLLVRGPWIVEHYFKEQNTALVDGWFPTGDVATIDADGYMQITDRSKDVIKSGGEWISSIDLENIAVSHSSVAEAGVVAVPHPKWDERPLLVVVRKPGCEVSREELIEHFTGKVAKWWMPDDVVFVDQLPHTATGKILKTRLREEYRSYKLPTA